MIQLQTIAHLPVGLYDEIAIGREGFAEVFARYGYDAGFAESCREDKRFLVIVNERRVELEKAGQLHVHRAAAVADMALTELAKRVTDPHTTTPVVLSIYQTAAKLGRLEPQPNAQVAAGPGFSISIHLTNRPLEKEIKNVSEDSQTIELSSSEVPDYIKELEYKE